MEASEKRLTVLMENHMWDHLEGFTEQDLSAKPDSSIALSARGFVQLRNDDTGSAKQLFLDALQVDADDPLPKYGLHLCYYSEGDFTGAEHILLGLLKDNPDNEFLIVARCWLYAKFRRKKIAGEAIAAALQQFPKNESLLKAQLFHAKSHSKSLKIKKLSTSLLKLYPENALAHVCLGDYYLKMNDLVKAEEHIRAALSVSPNEANARMLEFVEARKSGAGSFSLFLWAIKRKLLKLFMPGFSRRERLNIDWNR